MSVRIMTAVWAAHLPDSEKLVLLALADCANDEGLCWPSMATLAAKCSKSDRTVQVAIKRLVAAGQLVRDEVPGKGCRYTVTPTPEAASPPKRLHPRSDCGAPPKPVRATPEAASDKPSKNHQRTVNKQGSEPPSPALRPEHVLEAWNAMAGRLGLAKAKMNEQRRRTLLVRIRFYSIEDFTEAINCIERNPWMHGANERGWRADFDFLLQAKSFAKLVEGSYDRAQ